MNFREYFEPIDILFFEEPVIIGRGAGQVDPSISDPKTGKSYRSFQIVDQLKQIRQKQINRNVDPADLWLNFSCVNRLGINYVARVDGGTPLGLYAYPLDYVIQSGIQGVPTGGDRNYILIFKLNRKKSTISIRAADGSELKNLHEIQKTLSDHIRTYLDEKKLLFRKWIRKKLQSIDVEGMTDFLDTNINNRFQKGPKSSPQEIEANIEKVRDFFLNEKEIARSILENIIIKIDNFMFKKIQPNVDDDNYDSNLRNWQTDSNDWSFYLFDSIAPTRWYDPALGRFASVDTAGFSLKISEKAKLFITELQKVPLSELPEHWKMFLDLVGTNSKSSSVKTPNGYSLSPEELEEYENQKSAMYKFLYLKDLDEKRKLSNDKLEKVEISVCDLSSDRFLKLIQKVVFIDSMPPSFIDPYRTDQVWDYLKFHCLEKEKKDSIIKIINLSGNKMLRISSNFEKRKEKLIDELDMPFIREIKDYCKQNSISWIKILDETFYNESHKLGKVGSLQYLITKYIASELKKDPKFTKIRQFALWKKVIRDLGITEFLDEIHSGTIHGFEKTQGLFISPKNIKLITVLENPFRTMACRVAGHKMSNPKQNNFSHSRVGLASMTPHERWYNGIYNNLESIKYKLQSLHMLSKKERIKNLRRFTQAVSAFIRQRKKDDNDFASFSDKRLDTGEPTVISDIKNFIIFIIKYLLDYISDPPSTEEKESLQKITDLYNFLLSYIKSGLPVNFPQPTISFIDKISPPVKISPEEAGKLGYVV